MTRDSHWIKRSKYVVLRRVKMELDMFIFQCLIFFIFNYMAIRRIDVIEVPREITGERIL